MEGRHFPVGIETFSAIREENYVYVDKTELIHRLVTSGKYYFLSRPRRFGKSLLLSTIEAFFEGRRDLFNGLAIMRHQHSWEKHPVFHLNFVNANLSSEEGIKENISQQIEYWEKEYGIATKAIELPQRFYAVIRSAVEQSGKKAAVLIDEYDKALVSTFNNEELHNKFKAILKPIYGTLKAADRYICFGLITGVSRFSRLSIFSDINNLSDISLDNTYATICGITEEEMLRDCQCGIERLSATAESSFDDTVALLKKSYDGYHFTSECPDIYNPFSLFCAFEREEIGNYWFATGTPTFLIERLRNSDTYLPELFHSEVDTMQLADIDYYSSSPIALLFQTGYLTIKDYDSEYKSYFLGLPNREVANGFFKELLPVYMDDRNAKSLSAVRGFCRQVNAGDAEGFMSRLQAFLADIPYDLSKNKPEVYFENNIYIIFKLMGFTVETEYRTSVGRIDLLVKTKRFIYVIELKLNGSAEDAIAQIEEKNYSLPFATDPRTLFKIGISFSKETRNIDSWIIRNGE
ncbi:MAG: ATP-binding protein [Muribaculaceae bacterium]|nr:ATP-binding protein [Muribaculaceae bacterium]